MSHAPLPGIQKSKFAIAFPVGGCFLTMLAFLLSAKTLSSLLHDGRATDIFVGPIHLHQQLQVCPCVLAQRALQACCSA
jgi:hypothetical protein